MPRGLNGSSKTADKPMMLLRETKSWAVAGTVLVAALLLTAASALGAPATYKGASSTGDVVFFETEERLVPGDTDNKRDIYERSFDPNVEGGTYVTRQVSTGLTGGNDAYSALFEGNSPDGGVAFFSTEESLVGSDKDKRTDVYMRELSGVTTLLSVATASCSGTCGNSEVADATFVGVSADGSVVFFTTNEPLDEADSDNAFDLYAYDRGTGKTALVSSAAPGCTGSCGNGNVSANFGGSSEDGDIVYFTTAESLAPQDGDQFQDVYRHNLGGDTALITPAGACPGLECDAVFRGTTSSGGSVFFQTTQPIDPADTDEEDSDLYVWSGGVIKLVSRPDPSCGGCVNEHQPATFAGSSADGAKVIFQTSEVLAAGDANSSTDVYVRDLDAETTTLASPGGSCPLSACNAEYRAASADGNVVFFQTAARLDPADTDDAVDLYARDLESETTSLVSAPAAACAGCGHGDVNAKFAALAAGATKVLFSTSEQLTLGDEDGADDVYVRDLSGTPSTSIGTPSGVCPLAGEQCNAVFEGVSQNGSRLFFSTAERLTGEDVDSEVDLYERIGATTRLISVGNSVNLGPSTPILTATSPVSPNPSLEPRVIGQSDFGTSIKIYSTPDCSGAPVKEGTGTAAELAGSGIRVVVLPGSTTVFRATATDANGDTSNCSATGLKYEQAELPVTPPPPSGDGGSGATSGGSSGGGGGTTAPTGTGTGTGSRSKPGGGSVGSAQPVVPQTRITFGPASKTRTRRPVFRFTDATAQNGTEFRCRIDSGRWKGCSSPYKAKRLGLGRHAFSVKGVNSGLRETQAVSRKFKVVR
jgi:Tol biopolymer transport system component